MPFNVASTGTNITLPVSISDGGTGASSAATARSNLGITLPSGSIVGTTDTQTLTNKTINGASNTITINYFTTSGSAPTTTPTVTSSTDGLAIGAGAVATTGARAIAIGNSRAAGADSIALQIADNTSTYGAQGSNSIAIGYQAKATATGAVAIGYAPSASGAAAVAIGQFASATNTTSIALGENTQSTGTRATAIGYYAKADKHGQFAQSAGRFTATGDAQTSVFHARLQTTGGTTASILLDGSSGGSKVVLANNSSVVFSALIVGRKSDGTTGAYELKGVIKRGATTSITALVGTVTKTVLAEDDAAWDVGAIADTTNGALDIQVTGAASTTIDWSARITTAEVTF